MLEFLSKLFDTSDFPPRWHCGNWSDAHGTLHILSDLAIFGAYMAIPAAIVFFLLKRRRVPYPRVFVFFALFIVTCGFTHLLEAVIFYAPIYRLAGVAKLLTALASWATVLAMVPAIPTALSMKTSNELEAEIERRTAELRAAERELARANELLERRVEERTAELQRSNRELQAFAYAASHDLREPLRMISAYTELLIDEYGAALDDPGREYLDFAHRGARRMQSMLNALLQYSRVGSNALDARVVTVDEAVANAADDLKLALEESGASLSVGPIGEALGDAVQLSSLFQNLLSNAIKFAGDRPPRIEISGRADGDRLHVEIRDHGIGFDMRHHDRIFRMFERLHRDDTLGGTGVGLAIARRIAERHDGRLWAESEPGKGSVFHLTLQRR